VAERGDVRSRSCVPKPYGDSIMLEILRESGGVALAVSDEQILASLADWRDTKEYFFRPRELPRPLRMIICLRQVPQTGGSRRAV